MKSLPLISPDRNPSGPAKISPHALVLGDDGEHHVRRVRDGVRVVHDPQAALCLCLAGLGVAVPGHYFAAALVEPLRNRGAHPPETDQTDFHLKHPPGPLPQRFLCDPRRTVSPAPPPGYSSCRSSDSLRAAGAIAIPPAARELYLEPAHAVDAAPEFEQLSSAWLEPCHSCHFFASIYPIREGGSREGGRRLPPSKEGRHDQRTTG